MLMRIRRLSRLVLFADKFVRENLVNIMRPVLFLFAVIVVACVKEKAGKPLPVIAIATPSDNQHYSKGDTVKITGRVTHSVALTEVAVHITDLGTNNEFFHNHFGANNQLVYDYSSWYAVPDNSKASFKIEVEATDSSGTSASKEIKITLN